MLYKILVQSHKCEQGLFKGVASFSQGSKDECVCNIPLCGRCCPLEPWNWGIELGISLLAKLDK